MKIFDKIMDWEDFDLFQNFRSKNKYGMKNIYGTGDGSTVVFYLNGFQHQSLSIGKVPTFMIGISDAKSSFDMIYGSTTIKAGQVLDLLRSIPIYISWRILDPLTSSCIPPSQSVSTYINNCYILIFQKKC